MKYTREQAEAMILDWNEHQGVESKLHTSDIEFLNAKFPPIEVGKWYKSINGSLIRATGRTIGGLFEGFGFNTDNKWEHSDYWGARFFAPATNQEVLDRLTDHAKNIYKVGDRVMSVIGNKMTIGKKDDEPISEFINGYFFYEGVCVLNLSTGEWAEVVESTPSNPIHDKIAKFERELAELKKLINK
jgi:hypothetical protein